MTAHFKEQIAQQLDLAKTTTQACILCREQTHHRGVFAPNNSQRFGAPQGKIRAVVYPLCEKHDIKNKEIYEQIEMYIQQETMMMLDGDKMLYDGFSRNLEYFAYVTGMDKEKLRSCPLIRIDNIAEYFYAHASVGQGDLETYPNLAAPFEVMWMEWPCPKMVVELNGDVVENNSDLTTRLAALFACEHYEDGFLLRIYYIQDVRRKIISRFGMAIVVDKFGKADPSRVWFMRSKDAGDEDAKEWEYSWPGALAPAFLAVSFMHCKNVELVEHKPRHSPSGRVRHGPRISYHTLRIEPLKNILRSEGNVHHTGLKQALHICRGHFKDYSKGGGLFGRYKGLYWWDMQVRGNQDAGEIRKDYEVKL